MNPTMSDMSRYVKICQGVLANSLIFKQNAMHCILAYGICRTVSVCVCVYVCVFVYVCMCMRVRVCPLCQGVLANCLIFKQNVMHCILSYGIRRSVSVCVCMCACLCMYVCMYVCTCVCAFVRLNASLVDHMKSLR